MQNSSCSSNNNPEAGETVGGEETLLPRIAVITPCSRPENLDAVHKSINFDIIHRWIIVYDTKRVKDTNKRFDDPRIQEVFHPSTGKAISGNAQRNVGINLLLAEWSNGYVYFLDDDNIIHDGFYDIAATIQPGHFYTFDQQRQRNAVLFGNNIRVGSIDTAQGLIDITLINRIRFIEHLYAADGIFFEEVFRNNPKSHVYIAKIGAHYNKLVQK
jgi:hypothetical protein